MECNQRYAIPERVLLFGSSLSSVDPLVELLIDTIDPYITFCVFCAFCGQSNTAHLNSKRGHAMAAGTAAATLLFKFHIDTEIQSWTFGVQCSMLHQFAITH